MDLIIAQDVWAKLWQYTHSVTTEIGAWGYVEQRDEDMYVYDVFLVPQHVSSTEVDFVSEGLPYAIEKAMDDGKIDDLRFMWHSHVNMQVGFSATDEDCIAKLRDYSTLPWLVSAIFNKKGETNGRLDLFKNAINMPGIKHVPEIPMSVVNENAILVANDVVKEIDTHVKKAEVKKANPKAVKQLPSNTSQMNWWDDYDWGDEIDERPWDTTLSFDELSEAARHHEIPLAIELLEQADEHGWERAVDSVGWCYLFEKDGAYIGECLNLDDIPEEVINEYK